MSNKEIHVMLCIGTRPEIIKMVPVIRELRQRKLEFKTTVVFTAQHREMLDQMATFFNIEPDDDLNLMKAGQSLSELNTNLMPALHAMLDKHKPDLVLAQGDTSTVLATARASYQQGVPFGHVEAGLRSYDFENPYPEEMNRRLVALLGSLHFAPTEEDKEALEKEGVAPETIFVTGNTVVDTVLDVAAKTEPASQDKMVLITVHRRENFGEPLKEIFSAIQELATTHREYKFVYPVHPNPNVKAMAHEMLSGISNVELTEPLSYGEFIAHMKSSRLILSDSGGIQEEAPSLNVPVIVLRKVTERNQAIHAGVAQLAGTDKERIVSLASAILSGKDRSREPLKNPFGDGHSAVRIVDLLTKSSILSH